MDESKYYSTVEKWLREKKGCFYSSPDCGTRYARADVIGVHHIGGDLSTAYELIAVEVKTDEPFFKSISQAAGYSIFAHRCYLADYEPGDNDFTSEQVEIALSLGVGLLKIRSRSQLTECLSAPPRTVRQRFALQMLESIGFSECVLCRGVFKGTYKEGVKRADRVDVLRTLRRAIEATKDGTRTGYLFWSEGAVKMKASAGGSEENTARRYVCPDCLVNIIGPLLPNKG
jgi:hypothetical protein